MTATLRPLPVRQSVFNASVYQVALFDGVPGDPGPCKGRFEVFQDKQGWVAWTGNTFCEATQAARREFAASLPGFVGKEGLGEYLIDYGPAALSDEEADYRAEIQAAIQDGQPETDYPVFSLTF